MNCMEFMLARNGLAALIDNPVETRPRSNSRDGLIGLPAPPLLNTISACASRSPSRRITSRYRATRLSKRYNNLSAAFLVLKNKNLGRTSERIRRALSAANIRGVGSRGLQPERVEDQGPASAELYLPPPMDDGFQPSSDKSMELDLPPTLAPDASLPGFTLARSKSLDLPLPPMMGEAPSSPVGALSMRRSVSLQLDPLPPLDGRFTRVSPLIAPETHASVLPSVPNTYPRAVAPVAMHKLPSPPRLMARISSPSMQSRNLKTGDACPKYHKNDVYPYWTPHYYPKRAWLRLSKESYVPERTSWAQWSTTGLDKEEGMTLGSGYGGDEEDEDGLEYIGHTYRSKGPDLSTTRNPPTEEHDPWAYFMKGFEHEVEESDSDLWVTESE